MRRGSHSHHVPHEFLAQMEPVSSVRAVNTTPTSTDDTASASQPGVRFHRYMALATAVTRKAT